ncbi:MAG TPA: trypsin-like peptidase domain-containing protein [Candidatus Eremiobacteraceae bacterium]|jgi:serine protease Do
MPEPNQKNVTEIDNDLAAIAARLRRSTAQVFPGNGRGSGLIARADGTIVTNAHVVHGKRAKVVLDDGRELDGEVVAKARERDLAAIRVDARDLPVAEFRDARTLRAGEIVLAVGNPLDLVGALTSGIIHSVDRTARRVVADLTLLPGNSGGPLADASGRVVGVNSMVVNGLAVAIASSVVKRFIASPSERPYIGIVAQPVQVPVMGEQRLGLLITDVADRSPADRARLMPGRIVIGVGGALLHSPDDLAAAVDDSDVGASLRLDLLDGERVGGIEVFVGDASRAPKAA